MVRQAERSGGLSAHSPRLLVTYTVLTIMGVREYQKADGASPFGEWFSDLDPTAAAKVVIVVTRLEQGNFSKVKGVGSGVFEYVLDFWTRLPHLFWEGW